MKLGHREHAVPQVLPAELTGLRLLKGLSKPLTPARPTQFRELAKRFSKGRFTRTWLQVLSIPWAKPPWNLTPTAQEIRLEFSNVALRVGNDVVEKMTARDRVGQIRLQPGEPRVELAVELNELLARHTIPGREVIDPTRRWTAEDPTAPPAVVAATYTSANIVIELTGIADTIVRA